MSSTMRSLVTFGIPTSTGARVKAYHIEAGVKRASQAIFANLQWISDHTGQSMASLVARLYTGKTSTPFQDWHDKPDRWKNDPFRT